MASQALYRKWRSQTFGELVGQEHVVQTLRNAIQAGRVGHAYLFTGPRGVGKTTVARLLAKAVNCEAPLEARPCDACEPCRAIAEGRAVDVIEMDAASHTGVDDAREIIERVQFRPTSFRTKVYVIDETHMLSTAAFNALLKTLEEPPPHVLFILATTEFHKVPATIVSRCQRFVFTRHSLAHIASHLEHVAREEQVVLDPGVADVIARAATGAMRDALSVLDQLMAGSEGRITLAQAQALLGATASGDVLTLIGALADGNLPEALRTINEVAENGADLRQFARDLVERLRSLMLLAAAGGSAPLDLPDDAMQEMQELAGRVDIGRLVQWLQVLSNLDYQLKNSPYGQLPLELAVVELLTAPVQSAPVLTRPASAPAARPPAPTRPRPAEPAASPGPVPPRAPDPEPDLVRDAQPSSIREHAVPVLEEVPASSASGVPALPSEAGAPEPVVISAAPGPARVIEVEDSSAFLLDEVQALWPQFVEDIRAENRLVYAQIEGVNPINIEEQTIVLLASKGKWQKSMLEQEKTRRLLERMLSKLLHNPARIRITMDEREEMPDARKQLQHARNDPLVRKALNIFEAEVVGIDTP
ncbi:MAG TPA: DNA polymerase III subunit gamma/tau [Herpetosiphonaceae bacterium]|nr:DNA polymerase III subunit gamma/tau [Herpetosiphonaceae bacterium]